MEKTKIKVIEEKMDGKKGIVKSTHINFSLKGILKKKAVKRRFYNSGDPFQKYTSITKYYDYGKKLNFKIVCPVFDVYISSETHHNVNPPFFNIYQYRIELKKRNPHVTVFSKYADIIEVQEKDAKIFDHEMRIYSKEQDAHTIICKDHHYTFMKNAYHYWCSYGPEIRSETKRGRILKVLDTPTKNLEGVMLKIALEELTTKFKNFKKDIKEWEKEERRKYYYRSRYKSR